MNEAVEGLILCGGTGSRLGGRDKGLIPYAGRTAVECVAETLRPLCSRLLISANRNLERYEALGIGTVFADRRDGFQGPLAALEAAAGHSQAPLLLVLPCDIPEVSTDLVGRLLEALTADPQCDVVHAATGSDSHYLCAALRSACLAGVSARLDRGERAVRHWLAGLQVQRQLFTGRHAAELRNLNQPQDWPGKAP